MESQEDNFEQRMSDDQNGEDFQDYDDEQLQMDDVSINLEEGMAEAEQSKCYDEEQDPLEMA